MAEPCGSMGSIPHDYNGFGVAKLQNTKKGFEFSISYNTVKINYQVFNFEFIKGKFYFTKYHIESYNRMGLNNTLSRNVLINPPVKMKGLDLEKYMQY